MQTIFKNTIITQAIELGFDFDQFDRESTVEEVEQCMLDFFNENYLWLPQLEDECEVTGHGNSQNVSYGDFTSSGQIVNFSDYQCDPPDKKVFHSNFVLEDDGEMKTMYLYYIVGETLYNM